MVGTTLRELRDRIDGLASDDGAYRLVCARTGERPIPVDDKRFPDRETAATAATATQRYRAALRRYDPRAPFYDVIACEGPEPCPAANREAWKSGSSERRDECDWSLSEPVVTGNSAQPAHRRRIVFCHDVAAAVFEALSASGYDAVESAVMDAYLDLAERLSDPDDLCLCLVESMAGELDRLLTATEQATLLTDAAARLGTIDGDEDPLLAACSRFQRVGMIGQYRKSPWSIDGDGTRSIVVDLDAYALSPSEERLPVLPIVLDLFRRHFDRHVPRVRAVERANGWRVVFELATTGTANGLACAPIEEGV